MPIFNSQEIQFKSYLEEFLYNHIKPNAAMFDESQSIPRSFFHRLAEYHYLGASIPKKWGGLAYDYMKLGLMHEIFGKGLSSLQNILTVIGMVCKPLAKYGTEEQRRQWLPKIASGEILVALALTEPNVGSDLKEIETHAEDRGSFYSLNGVKKYITLGQIADLFLVLAKTKNGFVTFLVEKTTPGVEIKPIKNILSLKSNMLAEIKFNHCEIPKEQILGKEGTGLSQVIMTALDEGRYTTACGCVGLAQACLDESREYANQRKQSNITINNHQLILKLLTEMIVEVKAAREVCYYAGRLRDQGDISYISETLIAKYYSSKIAVNVSSRALQIFGAAGFTKEYSIERFCRDAKVMQVIEGTPQIYEINIPKNYFD